MSVSGAAEQEESALTLGDGVVEAQGSGVALRSVHALGPRRGVAGGRLLLIQLIQAKLHRQTDRQTDRQKIGRAHV